MTLYVKTQLYITVGRTYPFVDVHLQCLVVTREEIGWQEAGFIALLILKPGTQTHAKTQLLALHNVGQPYLTENIFLVLVWRVKRAGFSPCHYWFCRRRPRQRPLRQRRWSGRRWTERWLPRWSSTCWLPLLHSYFSDQYPETCIKGIKQNNTTIKQPTSALRIFKNGIYNAELFKYYFILCRTNGTASQFTKMCMN